jgi:dolichol kinase
MLLLLLLSLVISRSALTMTAVKRVVSPWLWRMETALVLVPLAALLVLELQQQQQSMPSAAGLGFAPATCALSLLVGGEMASSACARAASPLMATCGVAVLALLLLWFTPAAEEQPVHSRRGASSGLLLGGVSLPLVFASQLSSASPAVQPMLLRLLWLSLCCGFMVISQLRFGRGTGVTPLDGPDRIALATAAVLTVLASAASGAASVTAITCLFFALLLRFFMHTLPYSFTSGEAIAVASMLAMLFAHTTTSLLAQLVGALPLLFPAAAASSWMQHALAQPLSTASMEVQLLHSDVALSSVRFANACIGLIGGVSILGVLWYWPFLVPLREKQIQQEKATASREGAVPDTVARPSSPSRRGSAFTVVAVHMLLALFISFVLWPYIWLGMGTEPFTFVLAFLVRLPKSNATAPARESSLFPFTLQWSEVQQLDLTVLVSSPRFIIVAVWAAVVVLAVFVFAPMGTAHQAPCTAVRDASAHVAVAASSSGSHLVRKERASLRARVTVAPIAPAAAAPLPRPPVAANVASSRGVPNIVLRKYYHLLAVALFVPSILLEPGLVSLSFAVALSLFVLMEYIRLARLPPFGASMHQFMQTYLDTRDAGIVVLTHTYLLIGCALPLWIHMHELVQQKPQIIQPAATAFNSALQDPLQDAANAPSAPLRFDLDLYLPSLCGVLMLGIGDTMASLVGVWLGRHRWFGSSRSLEGTDAAVLSILAVVWSIMTVMHTINQTYFDNRMHITPPVRDTQTARSFGHLPTVVVH